MKKQFDWRRFKREKIAVHCKTEEEAKDFCQKMHEQGMKWSNENSYLEYTNYSIYKDKTYYLGDGCYCGYEYCKREEYTILEWSDYMQKEFTKADLKDGMVVEQGDKERYLVVGDRVLKLDGFNNLSQYENDLTNSKCGEIYGIERVFKVKTERVYGLDQLFDDKNLELIWERTETKRMIAEEMRQKLEELTGEKIEIEPSRNEMIGVLTKYCSGNDRCDLCCIRKECEKNGKYDFWYYSTESLKQCYENVIANKN